RGGAGGLERGSDGDQRPQQHDDRPVDGVIDLAYGQDVEQDVEDRDQPQRHREREEPEGAGEDGGAEQPDGGERLVVAYHGDRGGDRKTVEPADRLVDGVGRAKQQQDVADCQRRAADALLDDAAVAGEADQGDVETAHQVDGPGMPADDVAVGADHRLPDGEVGGELGLAPGLALELEAERTRKGGDRLGPALNHKQIARLDLDPTRAARHALAAAHEAGDDAVVLLGCGVEVAHALADGVGTLVDHHFGGIAGGRHQFGHGVLAGAFRNEAPADGRHEGDAGYGADDPDGREVEHGEGRARHGLAIARDDEVGRGADHGQKPAQDRQEGERHEGASGRTAGFLRGVDVDRHQQRQRSDIVDEAGKHRSKSTYEA